MTIKKCWSFEKTRGFLEKRLALPENGWIFGQNGRELKKTGGFL